MIQRIMVFMSILLLSFIPPAFSKADISVEWVAPTHFADNRPITSEFVIEYRVYWGNESREDNMLFTYENVSPAIATENFIITNLAEGIWYVTASANFVGSTKRSDYSNEVAIVIENVAAPGAPTIFVCKSATAGGVAIQIETTETGCRIQLFK